MPLFAEAEQHEKDGRVHEAVILAQTCCEMVAARAIGALRRDPGRAQADYADLVTAVFPKNRDNTYSMLDLRARVGGASPVGTKGSSPNGGTADPAGAAGAGTPAVRREARDRLS
jgi:hypothetical protein